MVPTVNQGRNGLRRDLDASEPPKPRQSQQIGIQLGRAIRFVRLFVVDISQKELASRLSEIVGKPIDQAYVCQVEKDACKASVERFAAICQALDVEASVVVHLAERRYKLKAKGDIKKVYQRLSKQIAQRLAQLRESP